MTTNTRDNADPLVDHEEESTVASKSIIISLTFSRLACSINISSSSACAPTYVTLNFASTAHFLMRVRS